MTHTTKDPKFRGLEMAKMDLLAGGIVLVKVGDDLHLIRCVSRTNVAVLLKDISGGGPCHWRGGGGGHVARGKIMVSHPRAYTHAYSRKDVRARERDVRPAFLFADVSMPCRTGTSMILY